MKEKKFTVGILLVNHDNEVLLHLRDDNPSIFLPGMWAGIGGDIEKNETPEEAIIRELEEEISFKPKKLMYLSRYELDDRIVHIYYSIVDFKDPSFLPLREGVTLKFYTFNEIRDLYYNGKTNLDTIKQTNILKLKLSLN